jgi:hypothetical protein
VRIFLTSGSSCGQRKWTDTEVCGYFTLVRTSYTDIMEHPVFLLKVHGADEFEEQADLVMEMEIPLNFNYNQNLTSTFAAL